MSLNKNLKICKKSPSVGGLRSASDHVASCI